MANGKVKKYFKNLRKMVEGEGNIQKTRPADETRTEPFIQGGIGVTKQGEKPKKKDYLTGIKQPPLEAKHAGKVNLDNVKKVEYPFLRLTAEQTSDKSFETEGDTTKHPMLPGAKKTEYVLQKNGKNKIKTPGQKAKKKKKKKKLTEAVNVLSGNQVSQGVIGGTGESIGTKYSNRLFGGKTEKKSKKNKKKKGR